MELNEENIVGIADAELARTIADGRGAGHRAVEGGAAGGVAAAALVAAGLRGGGEGVDRAVLGWRADDRDRPAPDSPASASRDRRHHRDLVPGTHRRREAVRNRMSSSFR